MKIVVVVLVVLSILSAALMLNPTVRALPFAVEWSAPKAEITCTALLGQGGIPYNVLVVGESWARGGRILPDLQQALSRKLGGRTVHTCAIAFSGYNTTKVLHGLRHEIDAGHVTHLFGAATADSVLMLTGVNDQIQHIGSGAYAKGIAEIAGMFPASRVQAVSAPFVRPRLHLALPLRIKNSAQKFLHDGGTDNVQARYSDLAATLDLQVGFIRYQDFMPAFDPSRYNLDGIHLTAKTFQRYGAFLGSHVNTGSKEEIALSPAPKQS